MVVVLSLLFLPATSGVTYRATTRRPAVFENQAYAVFIQGRTWNTQGGVMLNDGHRIRLASREDCQL